MKQTSCKQLVEAPNAAVERRRAALISEKHFNMRRPECEGVLLPVKKNEAANPSDISLLGEMAIVSGAQPCAHTIHETHTFHGAFAFLRYLEYTNTEPRRCEASACPHAGIYDGYVAV